MTQLRHHLRCRIVPVVLADGEDEPLPLGKSNQITGLGHIGRKGLLHHDMFARFEGLLGHWRMQRDGHRDAHSIDGARSQGVVEMHEKLLRRFAKTGCDCVSLLGDQIDISHDLKIGMLGQHMRRPVSTPGAKPDMHQPDLVHRSLS